MEHNVPLRVCMCFGSNLKFWSFSSFNGKKHKNFVAACVSWLWFAQAYFGSESYQTKSAVVTKLKHCMQTAFITLPHMITFWNEVLFMNSKLESFCQFTWNWFEAHALKANGTRNAKARTKTTTRNDFKRWFVKVYKFTSSTDTLFGEILKSRYDKLRLFLTTKTDSSKSKSK